MQRLILLFLVLSWTMALLGFMELRHEVERIDPETALITNHFTGEVRRCLTYRNMDWSCRPSDIESRSFVFALIPFWPARTMPGSGASAKAPAEGTRSRRSQLSSDLVSNGAIGPILLVVSIFILYRRDEGEGGNADGGSEAGGDGGSE